MKKFFYFLGLLLVGFAIFVTFFSPSTLPISPLCTSSAEAPEKCLQTRSSLGDAPTPENRNTGKQDYVILGFAPYWNLKKLSVDATTHITHFAYFHLLLNGDGSIYTKVNKKSEDPGYTNYKRIISGSIGYGQKPLIITFMPESQTALTESIDSSTSRQNTIRTIVNTLKESAATGVNIDYEPLGDTTPSTRDDFTLFIQELRTQLDRLGPGKLLTTSIYASSASKPRIWDLAKLAQFTDYFVVMTYDYTMPNSNSSGPNAPLRGSGDLYEHDITKNIAEISKLIPSTKILLGIPFYGYEWDTLDSSKYSPATSKGSTASLERIEKMLSDKTLELVWDRNSLTPYGIATTSGQTSQIYFENETSMNLKIQFVKAARLGGVAIWALGYENGSPWVWNAIQKLK